ncbi:diaminopimelate decarboxylase [Mucisphaera calidilacus]|uniref:Diaminopimelate decarboxylase n=1 Tax=Mucisphaera calidilacus TaxID=2527982 RepID=A0A518C0F3_9BACT|nr:diaminopimelate decarboxylase [Mucisphaera calidilacus]QDU72700.1 Diaminopimelate decarboxylase [Mucisphaera calidilacus]
MIDFFTYRDGRLHVEDCPVDGLVEATGSPAYVYSKAALLGRFNELREAFSELDPIICYSIKSCSNLNLCRLLAEAGSGMDVVSGGELHRAKLAGTDLTKVVYAGVGKTDDEIADAIESGIGWFNIESEAEFENIASIAKRMGRTARGALRINPDVDPETPHEKTTTGKKESKFGVDIDRARRFFERYGRDEHLRLTALHLHIGSPVYVTSPYERAVTKALELIEVLKKDGFTVDALDIGGGYGTDYVSGQSPAYADYARVIVPLLRDFRASGGTVIVEPGRSIAANAGILVARVQYLKQGGRKKFVILDTGMHHLIRPTLYDAFHFIWPTRVGPDHEPKEHLEAMDMPGLEPCDVVGPICETGDYLALGRPMPPVARGDLVAVFSAGAYGMCMASHYNSLPRPVEVLVDGSEHRVIRRRETYDDIVALES